MTEHKKCNEVIDSLIGCSHVQAGITRPVYVCPTCLYGQENGLPCKSLSPLLEDAIAILKGQEARIMPLSEIKSLEHNDVVWLEDSDKERVIPAIVTDTGAMSDCIEFAISNRRIVVTYNDYSIRWRGWTSCPTDEQREAVKFA